jgi:hypothetical protein
LDGGIDTARLDSGPLDLGKLDGNNDVAIKNDTNNGVDGGPVLDTHPADVVAVDSGSVAVDTAIDSAALDAAVIDAEKIDSGELDGSSN